MELKYSLSKFEIIGSVIICLIPIAVLLYFYHYKSLDFIDSAEATMWTFGCLICLILVHGGTFVIIDYLIDKKEGVLKMGFISIILGGICYGYSLGGVVLLLKSFNLNYFYVFPVISIMTGIINRLFIFLKDLKH